MVSSLDLQVQVETRFGLSRTAPTSFAKCGQECLHGGACWWSKDISNVECVCPELAYGEWCENGSCPSPPPSPPTPDHHHPSTHSYVLFRWSNNNNNNTVLRTVRVLVSRVW
jgi:hypothetical protein